MAFMSSMSTPVVDVVDVIAVRYRDVPAALAVSVIMTVVCAVATGLALVVMVFMGDVQVPVMGVVDVIAVRYCDVPAAGTMSVIVACVFLMSSSHQRSPEVAAVLAPSG